MVGAVSLRKDDIAALVFANAMAMTGFGEKRIGVESYGRVERQADLPVFVFPHIRAKPRYASSARNSAAGANACAPRGAHVNRPAAKSLVRALRSRRRLSGFDAGPAERGS